MVGFLRRTSYTFYLPILFHYFSPKKLFVKMIESWIDFFFSFLKAWYQCKATGIEKKKQQQTGSQYSFATQHLLILCNTEFSI